MKRAAKIIGNIAFYLLIASIIFSVVSQQFVGRAWGWTMVSGSSMQPTLEEGDYTFIVPYFTARQGLPEVGKVAAFEDIQSSWIIHRLVDVGEEGYITKGDGNLDTDQAGAQPAVMPSKIHGFALTFNDRVMRIPTLGALALRVVSSEVRLPIMVAIFVLLAVLLVSYFRGGRRRRPRPRLRLRPEGGFKGLYSRHETLFKYSGITVIGALILLSAMVKMSSTMDICYGVAEIRESQPMMTSGGLSLGIVPVGSEQSRNLSVSSDYPVTMVTIFVDDDTDLTFPGNPSVIAPRQDIQVEALVTAREDNTGIHTTPVTMLVLPPVLPVKVLYHLAQRHQLLAMFAAAVVTMLAVTVPVGVIDHRLGRESRSQKMRRLRRMRRG